MASVNIFRALYIVTACICATLGAELSVLVTLSGFVAISWLPIRKIGISGWRTALNSYAALVLIGSLFMDFGFVMSNAPVAGVTLAALSIWEAVDKVRNARPRLSGTKLQDQFHS